MAEKMQEAKQKGLQTIEETGGEERWQQSALRASKWIAAILMGGAILSTLVIGGGGLLLLALPVIIISAPVWLPAITIFTVTSGGLLLFVAFMYAMYRGGMYVYCEIRDRPQVQEVVDQTRQTGQTISGEAQSSVDESKGRIGQVAEDAKEYGQEAHERAKNVFYG